MIPAFKKYLIEYQSRPEVQERLIQDEIKREAKKNLARHLKMLDCLDLGHQWKFMGGRNCGCGDGDCSVPVYKCSHCGIYDYGVNDEAGEIKLKCQQNKEKDY